jgi:hypothetical protein
MRFERSPRFVRLGGGAVLLAGLVVSAPPAFSSAAGHSGGRSVVADDDVYPRLVGIAPSSAISARSTSARFASIAA